MIVFGAGDAGTILISRLTAEPDAAYRPVAILDDDPDKRRLRIRGIPVLGDRTRMAEVAAATGATVLVIAIWVTICPRSAPVSAASASLNNPLIGFQIPARTALLSPWTGGGQPVTSTELKPAAAS